MAGGIYGYSKYGDMITEYHDKAVKIARSSKREDFTGGQTTVFYDSDGELITSLRSGKEAYYLEYEDIPKNAINAMIVTEDRKFYSHNGIDIFAIARAAIELVRNDNKITQGASTITQQLARGTYLSYDVTYERKITEIFLAMELEKKYSKADILEFYLNNIYFSNGFYGLQAASFGYFGKSVRELTLSETVFLCAIPNNPGAYDPYKFLDDTVKRRDRMLKQMYEHDKITKEEYEKALSEEIKIFRNGITRNNYVETYSKYCAVRALMETDGFTFKNEYDFTSSLEFDEYAEDYDAAYEYWQQRLYAGGYRVYTSIDLKMQDDLQEAVNSGLAHNTETSEEGVYSLQASSVCIDNSTGLVKAIVGGREQEFAGYTLNRAYQSFRQPGSAIKPLIVYTPLFERGLSPDDIVNDEYKEGGPHNAGDVYSGEVTVRFAVERSRNTVAQELFNELTPEVGLKYLKNMNFRKIVKDDYVPAASLGGLTYGVSALEMAAAYSTLQNDGVYRTPTCIERIVDADGRVVYEGGKQVKRIYEINASRVMTDILKGVLTEGTGKSFKPESALCAAKTGTTTDSKDGWFVGYSTYYTCAVWVGYDYPKIIEDLSSDSHPGKIWKTFMDGVHEGLPVTEFERFEPIPQTRFGTPKEYEENETIQEGSLEQDTAGDQTTPGIDNTGDDTGENSPEGDDNNNGGWGGSWEW